MGLETKHITKYYCVHTFCKKWLLKAPLIALNCFSHYMCCAIVERKRSWLLKQVQFVDGCRSTWRNRQSVAWIFWWLTVEIKKDFTIPYVQESFRKIAKPPGGIHVIVCWVASFSSLFDRLVFVIQVVTSPRLCYRWTIYWDSFWWQTFAYFIFKCCTSKAVLNKIVLSSHESSFCFMHYINIYIYIYKEFLLN